MEEAEKIYQKDHPDVNVNVVETSWEDIQTKLTTAATSGQNDTCLLYTSGEVVKVIFLMELAGLKGRERLKGYDVASVITYEGK